jgi:hypothetical protein
MTGFAVVVSAFVSTAKYFCLQEFLRLATFLSTGLRWFCAAVLWLPLLHSVLYND